VSIVVEFVEYSDADSVEGFNALVSGAFGSASTTVIDSVASFAQPDPSHGPVCIRLEDGTEPVFRSGTIPVPAVDSGANLVFVVARASSLGADQTFSQNDVNGMLASSSSFPVVEHLVWNGIGLGTISVISASATVSSGVLSVTGPFTWAVGGLFSSSLAGTYTYTCALAPNADCSDVGNPLIVISENISLVSKHGGVSGWLEGLVLELFTDVFGTKIKNAINTQVTQAISASLATWLSQQHAPSTTTVTVQEVTLSSAAGIALQAWAGIPFASICSTGASSGSLKLRSREQMEHLRAIRDELLARSPAGVAYTAIFARHNPELSGLLARDPALLELADTVVDRALRAFPRHDPAAGVVDNELAAAVEDAMRRASEDCSPELRWTIEHLLPDLHAFTGRRATDVLDASWAAGAPRPPAD
jgi:hypothetical protein